MLDKTLLEVLVCPKTKAAVVQVGDKLYSTDRDSRLVYPIRDDIPIMLIDQAETASEEEFDRVMAEAKKAAPKKAAAKKAPKAASEESNGADEGDSTDGADEG